MTIRDSHSVREDFPILQQTIHGHPLIYFDNAASTQKPKPVLDALTQFYTEDYANINRGVHTLSERASNRYEQARETVSAFIQAHSAHECLFVKGTTEAIALVAQSFVRPRVLAEKKRRPNATLSLLITHMEHHSNWVPWQVLAEETGCQLKVWPVDQNGVLIMSQADQMLTSDVVFFALTHVSNVLGTVNKVQDLIHMAHAENIPVLVDGAQAVSHIPIDVTTLDADFYAFSSHKLYGPTGIGVLYGKAAHLEAMRPYQFGGGMVTWVKHNPLDGSAAIGYQPPPWRFEAGTPPIAQAIGLAAAIDYLGQLGWPSIQAQEKQLAQYALKALSRCPDLRLLGQATESVESVESIQSIQSIGIFSFLIPGIHAHDVGSILNQEGIAVRSGHHCALPLMTRLEAPSSTRVSLCFYNSMDEIDALIQALDKVKQVFS